MKHTVVHFELPADDLPRAVKFYRGVFGWKIEESPGFPGYLSVETGEPRKDLGGGIMARQQPQQGPVNYVSVESVADYSKRVEEWGGMVILPKMPVPGMGYFAQVTDTEGNVFGLWEEDAAAKAP